MLRIPCNWKPPNIRIFMLDISYIVILQYGMTTINNCETALLMLLSEGARHPYQIEKIVQDRDMRYWTELSMSSIYKTLRQLEKKGFASSEMSITNHNVSRKTYQLTDLGRTALKDSLREFLSVPQKMTWRIDLATSHLDILPAEAAGAALSTYKVEIEKLVKGYRDLEKYLADSGCPEHAMALARRPIFIYEAELEWLKDYRRRLGLPEGE
jgi:DNA-binding PadR family transcriptional regulator